MDKAPDAFRTISEVAYDLDIPQHVLRFWETRFAQIKPMKRSGGRRYYRPDDVDLLRGIRRLLYGEGYTIRGVQRILKEQGIKAVQGLTDGAAVPVFAAVSADQRGAADEHDDDEIVARGHGVGDRGVGDDDETNEIAAPVIARREPVIAPVVTRMATPAPVQDTPIRAEPPAMTAPAVAPRPTSIAANAARQRDHARLETVLTELIAARHLLDAAMKDG